MREPVNNGEFIVGLAGIIVWLIQALIVLHFVIKYW